MSSISMDANKKLSKLVRTRRDECSLTTTKLLTTVQGVRNKPVQKPRYIGGWEDFADKRKVQQ